MNVKLRRHWTWKSGLVYQDQYVINEYVITLGMLVNIADQHQQNIAYERIKYWIESVLDSAVFINQNSSLLSAYRSTGQKVIVFPCEPVDQIVGHMLYCKFNSICEDRLLITHIDISSDQGDHMIYVHDNNEEFSEEIAPLDWWKDHRLSWIDKKYRRKNSNIIDLARLPEWKDVGLSWQPNPRDNDDHNIVFGNFTRKNEDQ